MMRTSKTTARLLGVWWSSNIVPSEIVTPEEDKQRTRIEE